ncbi:hypothetical protein NPX13_g4308 [Xylaria arbuscula]|uniref:Uncharacterized protein n=1 Tax=Xylaria arbuscula TaxID=114810 RepID=A0A9W8NGL7_9PEZI|nr:hypothetical protein NPX13_g4308 [Xylaria arbuscula]
MLEYKSAEVAGSGKVFAVFWCIRNGTVATSHSLFQGCEESITDFRCAQYWFNGVLDVMVLWTSATIKSLGAGLDFDWPLAVALPAADTHLQEDWFASFEGRGGSRSSDVARAVARAAIAAVERPENELCSVFTLHVLRLVSLMSRPSGRPSDL